MRKIKLRSKFFVIFVSLAIIPLVIATSVIIIRVQNLQRGNAALLNEQIAATASESISTFVIKQFQILEGVGGIQRELFQDAELRDKILERSLFQAEDFVEMSIVDWSGKELNREHVSKVVKPSDLRDRSQTEKFKEVRRNHRYLGPLYISVGRPFFDIGVALTDPEGNFNGAIFAQVDARLMQDVVKDISISVLKGNGRVYIVDNGGRVIAHPDSSVILQESDFSLVPVVQHLLERHPQIEPTKPYKDEQGEEVLGNGKEVVMSISEEDLFYPGWFVIVEQPTSVAFREVRRITAFTFSVLIVVLFIALFVAVFFANRIVKPIERLHKASILFARGNSRHRVSIKTGDEIEDLAKAFNKMTESITASTDALKKERDQTAAIVASLGDGLIVYSPEKEIIFLNPRAQEMLWVSSRQVLGKSLKDKSAFPTPVLTNVYNVSTFPIKNWERKEYTIEAPKKVVLQIAHIDLKRTKGKNLGSMRVLHDITKEKEIEAIKSDFISLASHQLRTPLSAMKWSLVMLLKGDFGKLGKAQKEIIGITIHSNNRMIGLVDDLLDVSRIEEGQFGYHFSLGSLENLVEELLKRFSQQIQIKRLQFSYEKPKYPLPKVSIDLEKMEIALQNIIDNAMKYTYEKSEVKIYFKKSTTSLTVFVKDTGIGIPKDQQSRVFEKFFRATNAVQFQTSGSGLGLFIAESIVKAHRGEIGFVSQKNRGSTFYIRLPIDPKVMPKSRTKKAR